jgi:hypothetical protein
MMNPNSIYDPFHLVCEGLSRSSISSRLSFLTSETPTPSQGSIQWLQSSISFQGSSPRFLYYNKWFPGSLCLMIPRVIVFNQTTKHHHKNNPTGTVLENRILFITHVMTFWRLEKHVLSSFLVSGHLYCGKKWTCVVSTFRSQRSCSPVTQMSLIIWFDNLVLVVAECDDKVFPTHENRPEWIDKLPDWCSVLRHWPQLVRACVACISRADGHVEEETAAEEKKEKKNLCATAVE